MGIIVLLSLVEKMIDGCFALMPRQKPSPSSLKEAQIIAHRGAHNNAQGIMENTLQAFNIARDAGCWGIELDIHATSDSVLVVNHDPTLNRLWGHDEAIANLTFAALRALEPRIPSLAEVIAQYGRVMHLFIELKAPFNSEKELVAELCDLSPGSDYHLLSLDAQIFGTLSLFPKSSLVLVAGHNNVQEFCNLSLQEGYGGVTGSYLLLTDKKIEELKSAHQVYGVGFVNSRNSLYRELNREINWIFTNQAVTVCQNKRPQSD